MDTRITLYEVDFINKYIVRRAFNAGESLDESEDVSAEKIDPKLMDQFYTKIDPFWHSENDLLEIFVSFNDGHYLCQRKKLKYDFATKSNYWQSYNFNVAPQDKVEIIKSQIEAFLIINKEVVRYNAIKDVQEIGQESIFFERRYFKRINEKNMMISASDWRILPDIEDSYPGEKDMWVKWRKIMREETVKSPTEFQDPLDFLQYLYEIKYPIDPKIYREKYPNGEVEYLETDDQWSSYDGDVASDFVAQRLPNILNFSKQYLTIQRKVKSKLMEFIKAFGITDVYEDFNMDKFVIDPEENIES
jgi:hypothetical protein